RDRPLPTTRRRTGVGRAVHDGPARPGDTAPVLGGREPAGHGDGAPGRVVGPRRSLGQPNTHSAAGRAAPPVGPAGPGAPVLATARGVARAGGVGACDPGRADGAAPRPMEDG